MSSAVLKHSTVGVVAAFAVALLTSLLLAGGASAATKGRPFSQKSATVYACYKVGGKSRGALRVVKRPRACKRLRGWRRMSWSATGWSGANGARGPAGARGAAGPQGEAGAQGAAGAVEQSLIETVELQTVQIQELTTQVSTLTGEVSSLTGQVGALETTVESACTQLGETAGAFDELVDAVSNISLLGGVGTLEIPLLPDPLGTVEC